MTKIVTEHIHLAYKLAKNVYLNRIKRELAVDELVNAGMNAASAEMYLIFYFSLREGKIPKRTVNSEALVYFLNQIWEQESDDDFRLATKVLKGHLDYYEDVAKQQLVGKRVIQQEFETYLPFEKNGLYPDEKYEQEHPVFEYLEGARKTINVNAYERNPKARQACLNHYGYQCQVCGFDFQRQYGSIGKNFIHVHHKEDLACIDAQYQVNPIEDLVPVCPNCHAMLHQKKPAYSVDELKAILMQHA